nr:hypothetical protein [Nonlabens ulvanivorans]
MRIKLFLLILLTQFSCAEKKSDTKNIKETPSIETISEIKNSSIDRDSLEFLRVVKELEKIKFYVAGKDSVFVTKNIFDLNGKSGTNAFQRIFADSDNKMKVFNSIITSRKYHVKRIDGKTGNRPSANIIQLEFNDEKQASEWFSIYDKSPEKGMIQVKPKTELWLDEDNVYFIQTYHTPERDYLNLLKETMIKNMD